MASSLTRLSATAPPRCLSDIAASALPVAAVPSLPRASPSATRQTSGRAKTFASPTSSTTRLRRAYGTVASLCALSSSSPRCSSAISPSPSRAGHPPFRRSVSDFVRGETPTGQTIRYPLASKNICGTYQARGLRSYQEDTILAAALHLPPESLQLGLREPAFRAEGSASARGWEMKAGTAGEVACFGIFDGHGGKEVSGWLRDELANVLENIGVEEIEDVVHWAQGLGGYFRRFQGGLLSRRIQSPSTLPVYMTLAERATLAFLKADQTVLTRFGEKAENCGSTASVAFLHSLDTPSTPFFHAKRISLTTAHCGDTRILICPSKTGTAIALTEKHHADSRTEASRLRRLGAVKGGSVVDAFGESRWMGAVENTRSIGDGRWKGAGVTAEPQISTRVINGNCFSYLVFVTDGISSLATDQEIIDLVRTAPTPAIGARSVVSFAEDLGSQDNCSCMVVPLAGWSTGVGGFDRTKEMREYKRKEAESMNGRMRRG